MNELYGWVFIKDLDGNWCAAKREYYFELFNGDKGNVLKSPLIEDLVALITKTGGDKALISNLIAKYEKHEDGYFNLKIES